MWGHGSAQVWTLCNHYIGWPDLGWVDLVDALSGSRGLWAHPGRSMVVPGLYI